METNRYLKDVKQTNGCRVWENPKKNLEYKIPERPSEIFIKNIPKELFEIDILPHFERFGPVYQFRLLIDYDNCNRGFAYLIYFYEKSSIECLDLMGYFVIKPGVMIDVERSQERSHLLALNIPSTLSKDEIERGLRQLYTDLSSVFIRREEKDHQGGIAASKSVGTAVLAFPDHTSALKAKRWSGAGSVNLWNRNIKILWARNEQVEGLMTSGNEVKHVLVHNVPEDLNPEDFGAMMCNLVSARDIVYIRPMHNDWMIEFTNTEAARTIFTRFHGRALMNQVMFTEWVTNERMNTIGTFADFDFELRCLCIANYWDPPIFIYGRIIPFNTTQLVSVIIKNNRKNQFTTILIEINYENLIDIHARICELVVLIIVELKDLPKKNLVIKCVNNYASVVGAIADLNDPEVVPSVMISQEPLCLHLNDVYALSKMSYQLFASHDLESIHKEYEMILKEKNFYHQIICGVFSDDNFLGCIDPIYRHGKPLKYLMDSRHMILAMCDSETLSNIKFKNFPSLHDIRCINKPGIHFKVDGIEMIPIESTQREDVHYTFRPFIEFEQVDTFSPLNRNQKALVPLSFQDSDVKQETFSGDQHPFDEFPTASQPFQNLFNYERLLMMSSK